MDAGLKREAEEVLKEIGLSPRTALELFYAQVVKLRGLPFRPSAFPVLEEYGATREQAEAAEEAVIAEFAADRKAGRTLQFKGKLTARSGLKSARALSARPGGWGRR